MCHLAVSFTVWGGTPANLIDRCKSNCLTRRLKLPHLLTSNKATFSAKFLTSGRLTVKRRIRLKRFRGKMDVGCSHETRNLFFQKIFVSVTFSISAVVLGVFRQRRLPQLRFFQNQILRYPEIPPPIFHFGYSARNFDNFRAGTF